MSSTDDDVPLARPNGTRLHNTNGKAVKSKDTVTKSVDKDTGKAPAKDQVKPGISLSYGPVDDLNGTNAGARPQVNGEATSSKRKARSSAVNTVNYADATSSEDEQPLVKRRRRQSRVIEDDSDDDAPLVKKSAVGNGKPAKRAAELPETSVLEPDGDSDVPLDRKLKEQKRKIEQHAAKEGKELERQEKKSKPKQATPAKGKKRSKEADSDDEPIVKKKQQLNGTKATPKRASKVKKEESDDDIPLSRKSSTKKSVKKEATSPAKKASKKAVKAETVEDEEAEEEEEEYRWWNAPNQGDGSIKWTTLEHNGVVFPPPYKALPKNVKMKYDGTPVSLEKDAEEVAGFFGAMLNSTHNVENPTFQKNFFNDFKDILKKTGGATDKQGNKVNIKEFAKCNFTPIFEYYQAEKDKRNARTKAEKKAEKEAKDEAEAPYMYCMWDGRKQKVGNFRVEPPGLFRGRGEHPKTGMVKQRVQPEQITINIGKDATPPKAPEGHKWKEIKHDQQGTWLVMWQENINGAYKYVMLAANSDIKGMSDYNKFEKARELKKHILRIRKDYESELRSEKMADRQRATAMYLIDRLALRAGNEKGEDEADTVGCCSLKYEHVTLQPPNKVIFDFLGKDSIRYCDTVEVDEQVFKNLKIFKKSPKVEGDEIFDRLTTAGLNKHLSSYMPGLTAKVFRTYNASYTMSNLLKEGTFTGTIPEKVKALNDANRTVAVLCNHKRTITAAHAGQMEKIEDEIKGALYQKWRLKMSLLDIDSKLKRKKGADYFELDPEIDKEWIKKHQKHLVEEERAKIEKKFAKENEKRVAEGQKEMKDKELDERLEVLKEMEEKFKKENKSGKVEAEGRAPTVEKIETAIAKKETSITNMRAKREDKEANKEVALGTSKINYIDPRLFVSFSKKYDVPIERMFAKTLREKFEWAIKSVEADWEF